MKKTIKGDQLLQFFEFRNNRVIHVSRRYSFTKAYKKCRTNIKTTIDFEAKEIAANLDLSDRIAQLSERDVALST